MRSCAILLCIGFILAPIYSYGHKYQISKADLNITKQKCDLPEKFRFNITVNNFLIGLAIENKTNDKIRLELRKSLITFPAAEWESPLFDHMGVASQKVIVLDQGVKMITLYPAVLIEGLNEDSDKDFREMLGVDPSRWEHGQEWRWQEWPGKDGDVYNFSFIFSNSKGEEFQCQFSGKMSIKVR